MSNLRLTSISNQGGTASVPSDTVISGTAKAWVNFNGTGTVAIRASFNVTSITDNGTGDYTVNFTNVMSDANYTTIATSGYTADFVSAGFVAVNRQGDNGVDRPPTASACRINGVSQAGDIMDTKYMHASFFR